jgi:hypothetical protein
LDPVELIRSLPSSALLLLSVACAPGDLDCADAQCRAEAVETAMAQGPEAVNSELVKLPDVLERIAVISGLVDAHPKDANWLCPQLPRGMSRERCESVAERPHLWGGLDDSLKTAARAGPGPARSTWSATDVPASAVTLSPGSKGRCTTEVDPHACAWGHARQAALLGDLEASTGWCAELIGGGSSPDMWRYECFMMAAEAHVSTWDRVRFEEAMDLCGRAGPFRGRCVSETVSSLARRAPASDVGGSLEWAPQVMRAHDVNEAWADSSLRTEVMDRFWALSTKFSVAKAVGMSGDAMDVLPVAAQPHFRAALSHQVILGATRVPLGLDDAQRLVQVVLDRRIAGQPHEIDAVIDTPVLDLWSEDRAGESHFAAVSYLGESRRTVASDPQTDIRICVLEAAARVSPPWSALLEEGQSDPDERVRWTAVRLVEQLEARRLGTNSAP